MYIRQCFRTVEGERRAYWALVESVRTERGPRQNVVAWLLDPSSELYISEQWYPKTALPDLLGVPADRVDDNRLYRALDELLPHKEALGWWLRDAEGLWVTRFSREILWM